MSTGQIVAYSAAQDRGERWRLIDSNQPRPLSLDGMDAYAEFFKLIDAHARVQHQCFLAEMFIGSDPTAYTLCLRPSVPDRESPNRDACRYLNVAVVDVNKIAAAGSLDESTIALLNRELLPL